MTTVKSIPGLLRKLANTIERVMGMQINDATECCHANAQHNADVPSIGAVPEAIAKAVADELDRRGCARAASMFLDAQ